jgi:hypothetical protein
VICAEKRDRQIKGRITDRTDTGTDRGKGGQTREGMTDIGKGGTDKGKKHEAHIRGGGKTFTSSLIICSEALEW